jgi:hypothetical protein
MQKHSTPKEQINKWANELYGQFSKEEVQMTIKCMKKCSTSLAIREMQIKTILRFHFTLVRMTPIKEMNKKCW